MTVDQEVPLFRSPDAWLLHLGYVSEGGEQNLLLYGYLACPGITAAECDIDPTRHAINYKIALGKRAWMWYKCQRWLAGKRNLLASLGLYAILRCVGPFDPLARLTRCVRDYAGENWTATVEVYSERQFRNCVGSSEPETGLLEARADTDSTVRR